MKKKSFSERAKEFFETAGQIGLVEFIIFIIASVCMLRALGTLMLIINNANNYLTTAETFTVLAEYTLWLLWLYVEIRAIVFFFKKVFRIVKMARPGKMEVVNSEKVAQSTMRPINDALRDIEDRLTIIETGITESKEPKQAEESLIEDEPAKEEAPVEEPVKEEPKPEETKEGSEEQ